MHKSKGNAIWFDEAAEEIGVDVMRWLFSPRQPRRQPQLRLPHHRRRPAPIHPAAVELVRLLRHLRGARPLRSDAPENADPARRALRCSTAGSSPNCISSSREVRARARRLRSGPRRAGDRAVHDRRAVELVHPTQPPAILEERERRRQGRGLPDALREPDHARRAAGALHAVPGRGDLSEPRALGRPARAGVSPSHRFSGLPTRPHRRVAVAGHGRRARSRGRGPRSAPGSRDQGPPTAARRCWSTAAIPQMLESVLRLRDQVLDELNVKTIEPLERSRAVRLVHHPAEPAGARAPPRQAARTSCARRLAALDPGEVAAKRRGRRAGIAARDAGRPGDARARRDPGRSPRSCPATRPRRALARPWCSTRRSPRN